MTIRNSYLQLGKFFPPDWGGIESVSYNLLAGLTEQGFTNSALVFGDTDTIETLEFAGYFANIYRVKYVKLFRVPLSISYVLAFKRIAYDYEIVVVHLPNPVAAIALFLSGYRGRVVLYWHSDVVNKGVLGWLLKPLERWIISRADIVLAPTSVHLNYSRYASQLLPKGRIVHYPIDPRLVSTASLRRNVARSMSEKNLICILAIGRLVEYKGFEYLIRAIPALLCKYNIRVDILGDGPLYGPLNSLIIELKLDQVVFLQKGVTDERRESYLNNADIFCFPSITKQEMYGVVQIEAMAHGLPIISTDIPGSGSPELTRMTGAGIVIPPSSVNKITEAIEKLISDPALYTKLSTAGLNAIINDFNPSFLLTEFCSLCQGG